VRLWKFGTAAPRAEKLPGHGRRVSAAAVYAKTNLLASGSEDGFVRIWDLEKRQLLGMTALRPLRGPGPARFPAWGESARPFFEHAVKGQYAAVQGLAFSPDGRWLAVVLGDGSVS